MENVEEWNVDYVNFSHLEEWLNEASNDGWVLHTLDRAGQAYNEDFLFVVIMYKPKKAATRAAEKWQATVGTTNNADLAKKPNQKEAAEVRDAVEKWSLTMGTTGGHANE